MKTNSHAFLAALVLVLSSFSAGSAFAQATASGTIQGTVCVARVAPLLCIPFTAL